MDKLDQALFEIAKEETQKLPLEQTWQDILLLRKNKKRALFLRYGSMAATLLVGLMIGVFLGRTGFPVIPAIQDPPEIITPVAQTPPPTSDVPQPTPVPIVEANGENDPFDLIVFIPTTAAAPPPDTIITESVGQSSAQRQPPNLTQTPAPGSTATPAPSFEPEISCP